MESHFFKSFILVFMSFVNVSCGDAEAEEPFEPEVKEYGVLTTDPPAGWVQFKVPGKYCLFLPEGYEQKDKKNVNSPITQFKGDLGVVSVDYGVYSAGNQLAANANVSGEPVAVRSITLVENFSGYFGAEVVFVMYWKIDDSTSFDIVVYPVTDKPWELAKKIFGSARVGDDCP